jgi:choline dehydrogenase-like flavoprotein
MCAGAVQSPQLLMLSGIGPREHLQALGIEVVRALEGVGEGLQDHPAVLVTYECTKPISLTNEIRLLGTGLPNPLALLNWFVRGKGALTTVACEQGGFFRTAEDLPQPDLQVRFVPEVAMNPDGMNTLEKVGQGARTKPGFTFQLLACRPASKGRVRLRDRQPTSKPAVEGVYLSSADGSDLRTLREGIKLGRALCSAKAFDAFRGEEIFPGRGVSSDAEIEQYIRATIHSANALTGTCRIGAKGDPLAVLDPELRVRGVKALRVVDASAMPQLVGGQTAAPTIMLAEKASDLLLLKRAHLEQRSGPDRERATATPGLSAAQAAPQLRP